MRDRINFQYPRFQITEKIAFLLICLGVGQKKPDDIPISGKDRLQILDIRLKHWCLSLSLDTFLQVSSVLFSSVLSFLINLNFLIVSCEYLCVIHIFPPERRTVVSTGVFHLEVKEEITLKEQVSSCLPEAIEASISVIILSMSHSSPGSLAFSLLNCRSPVKIPTQFAGVLSFSPCHLSGSFSLVLLVS